MISSRNTLIFTSALADNRDDFQSKLIRELCDIPPEQWSPREKRIMQEAATHGEIYPMIIEEYDTYNRYITDLGYPSQKIFVQIPKEIDQKKAAECVQLLAEGLAS